MFGDTDLPLALIMEEILGWEKKTGEKDEEEKENTQLSSTSIFLRLLDILIHLPGGAHQIGVTCQSLK